jgi:hypothetical protein
VSHHACHFLNDLHARQDLVFAVLHGSSSSVEAVDELVEFSQTRSALEAHAALTGADLVQRPADTGDGCQYA